MSEQNTPTYALAWILNDAGMEGPSRLKCAEIVVAAGWKSPAEVAEMVCAAAEEGFDRATRSMIDGRLEENPYRNLTPKVNDSGVAS